MRNKRASSESAAFLSSLLLILVGSPVPRVAVAQGLPPVAVEVIGAVPEEQLTCERVGGVPIIGVIPYSGAVRVVPLNNYSFMSFGFTGFNGPSSFANMLLGGPLTGPGVNQFNSSSAAGTITLSVAIQNTNTPFASPARGSVVLGSGGLSEVQMALGPEANLTRVCVTQLALHVAGTMVQDLVGPRINLQLMDLDSQVEIGWQFWF